MSKRKVRAAALLTPYVAAWRENLENWIRRKLDPQFNSQHLDISATEHCTACRRKPCRTCAVSMAYLQLRHDERVARDQRVWEEFYVVATATLRELENVPSAVADVLRDGTCQGVRDCKDGCTCGRGLADPRLKPIATSTATLLLNLRAVRDAHVRPRSRKGRSGHNETLRKLEKFLHRGGFSDSEIIRLVPDGDGESGVERRLRDRRIR